MWTLNQARKNYTGPYEIEGTRGQRDNPQWLKIRSWYCGGSVSQTITGLTKDSAKIAFLRKHVHCLDSNINIAMQAGVDNENIAREKYREIMQRSEPNLEVHETGSWGNPKYPALACSPDALVWSPVLGEWILLEIKILTLSGVDPKKFWKTMTKKQMNGFYMVRDKDGKIMVRVSHKYYRQIQHSLCVLELDLAHLFVWSESGTLIREVRRDEEYFKLHATER